jgi:hypothetical protein
MTKNQAPIFKQFSMTKFQCLKRIEAPIEQLFVLVIGDFGHYHLFGT